MKRKKWIIVLVVAFAALAGGFLFLRAEKKPEQQLEFATVKRDTISHVVTATGTVEPITQVEVGTQVSGIISRIYVDYNSQVKTGQVIAELDRTVLESELASKQAELQASLVEYEYQQKNYDRQKLLYEKQLISDTDFETATYSYQTAKSSYERTKADLVKVKTNLNYATIYSPIDGIVLSRAVEEGQTVAASFSTPTLFTIANDLSKMEVVADVDEADIGQVEVGQRVCFTVDAYPNDVFEGEVTQVRLEATVTSNVVTYEVIVNAPNPQLKLKPGLTANITIYTLERNGVLTIPSKALRFTPDPEGVAGFDVSVPKLQPRVRKNPSGQAVQKNPSSQVVWIKNADVLEPRRITIGESSGSMVEVIDGLWEDQQVATGLSASATSTPRKAPSGETSPFMPARPGGRK